MSILTPPVPEVDDTHDEDMSLESESESEEDDHVDGDEEEAAQEEAAQVETVQEPMPIIQLSFDNARGGAWDDRELVHAYDSAMEEFHIHHPGPGSWLDKATAALAKGRPLPGAGSYDTTWYTASLDVPASESNGAEPTAEVPPVDPPPAKRVRMQKPTPQDSGSLPIANGSNPYSTSTVSADHKARVHRRSSPTYAPGSPPPGPHNTSRRNARPTTASGSQVNGAYVDRIGYDLPNGGIAPPTSSAVARDQKSSYSPDFGVQPTGQVSEDDALRHAMTAQYWAGYWMGVARSKSASNDVVLPPRTMQADGHEEREQPTAATNVLITRQQYHRPAVEHLRR